MQRNYHILELRVTSSSKDAVSFLSSKFDSDLENEGFKLQAWTYSSYADGTTTSLIAVRKRGNIADAEIFNSLTKVAEKTKEAIFWSLLGTYTDKEICDKTYAQLLHSPRYSLTKDTAL